MSNKWLHVSQRRIYATLREHFISTDQNYKTWTTMTQVLLTCPHVCILAGVWVSSVLRPHQHSIGYTGDGFYRPKDPTNSIKVLKEEVCMYVYWQTMVQLWHIHVWAIDIDILPEISLHAEDFFLVTTHNAQCKNCNLTTTRKPSCR